MNANIARSAARSQIMVENAAFDSALGAALGLMLACLLVAGDFDLRETLAQSGAPLSSLAGLVGVAVAQGAICASLGGAMWRKLAARD